MPVIEVNNLYKKFRVPHEKKSTVLQNIGSLLSGQFGVDTFWALKDVSFAVDKGETFGIIGKNGSGKSTLLKILANVLYPDSGSLAINGKVASFLELGVGFQPELTARENVYLYSYILGISKKNIQNNYEDIFDFAELKRFQNMKLKNFSSGMQLRLAFSTAMHVNPDIMLIDEVLAVGDIQFQSKCMNKISELRQQGTTIIFVSHDTNTIRNVCRRAMLLKDGEVEMIGDTDDVLARYTQSF